MTPQIKRAGSSMEEDQLQDLMRRVAQNRDTAAFSLFFDLLAPRIRARLSRLGHNHAEGDDLLQDVMVNIWTKAGLYDPARGNVLGWTFTILRNLRIDRLRKLRPHLTTELLEWDDISDEDNAEDISIKKSEAAALARSMAELGPEQREIIDLVFREELTQAEIAGRLKLPLGTVKSRMRLAYGHMRKALENNL
jgi:RNA polymerase sigma-70 factor (ECF subfamily)